MNSGLVLKKFHCEREKDDLQDYIERTYVPTKPSQLPSEGTAL